MEIKIIDRLTHKDSKNVDTEWLKAKINRHELIRTKLDRSKKVIIHNNETNQQYVIGKNRTLAADDYVVTVYGYSVTGEIPDDGSAVVVDEGFCYNPLEVVEVPNPENLIQFNFIRSKYSPKCGCVNCGFITEDISLIDSLCETPYLTDNAAAYTAICPKCHGTTIIFQDENEGIKIDDTTLWCWSRKFME